MSHLNTCILVLTCTLIACGGNTNQAGNAGASETDTPSPTPIARQNEVAVLPLQWGSTSSQWGELYVLDHLCSYRATVVMIHGGCWQSFYTLELQAALSDALARKGYAVWNIEYRSLGNGGEWPVMFQDVAAATDYLTEIAEIYPLDLDATVAMGHSAGGHLALWLAGRERITQASELYVASALTIKGSIALGGISDLLSSACGGASGAIIDKAELGDQSLTERLKNTSPIHMLPIEKPTVLISGERDNIVPPALSDAYTAAAQLAGDNSEHIVIREAGHFYLIDPLQLDLEMLDDTIQSVLSH